MDYRLFFADYTENTIDPDNVGIYAIGAVRTAESVIERPEVELHSWTNGFYIGASTQPGVFIPE